jgi:hypothetical protein
MDMASTAILSVRQAAKRAKNRKGGIGVSAQYIRAEIARGDLKAELITPIAGPVYHIITEEDFAAWEAKRGKKS